MRWGETDGDETVGVGEPSLEGFPRFFQAFRDQCRPLVDRQGEWICLWGWGSWRRPGSGEWLPTWPRLQLGSASCFLVLRYLFGTTISSSSFFPCLQRQVEVNVRNKILYLIQAWAHAFRNEPKYKVVQDTYQIMKVEGESGGWGREGPVLGLGRTIGLRGCPAPGGPKGGCAGGGTVL